MSILGTTLPSFVADILVFAGAFVLPAAVLFAHEARLQSRRVAEASDLLDNVIENLGEGFYRTTLDGRQLSANPALVALNGYDTEAEMLAAVKDIATEWYVEPNRRDEFLAILKRDGKVKNFVSEIYRHKTRERIWISENARFVYDKATGLPSHCEGTVNETTALMAQIRSEERLKKLTQHVPGGLFQLERNAAGAFEVVFSSQGFREMLDIRILSDRFDIEHFISLIYPVDLDDYYASLKQSRKSGQMWNHEFRVVTDGGKTKWLKVQATPHKGAEGAVIWHGYLQDVTVLKADEAQLSMLAYNDPLTKLPNRRYLLDRLQQALASCGRRHEHSALLYVDLDNFKLLNDTHGHEAGDRLLKEVALRMKRVVRQDDTVARLAGDEFVILLDGLSTEASTAGRKASRVAAKAIEALKQPFDLGSGTNHSITASIGVIVFDEAAHSVDDILRRADTAMYDVKRTGRNAYRVFTTTNDVESLQKSVISTTVSGAAARGEFELRFQQQVDVSGRVTGAEALVRWNHPKLGLLTPDLFMGAADQAGVAGELNRFVMDTSIATLKRWQSMPGGEGLNLSVNVGAEQLARVDFVRDLRNAIRAANLRSGSLTLEITEQLIAKSRQDVSKSLVQLKTTGVRLSLDDFGAGQTSLANLKDMPLDEVKIDGRYVKSIQNAPKDLAIVKMILAMAGALGLDTVAEHVETQNQERLLIDNGCKRFQGYLYGGAVSLADFEVAAGLAGSGNPDQKVA